MAKQLDQLMAELNANSERAQRLAAGLSYEQLSRCPFSGGWSVAECIEHLATTTDQYRQRLATGIKQAQALNKPEAASYKMDGVGRLFKWILEPPANVIKTKSPPAFQPQPENLREALPHFLASQKILAGEIERSHGLPLNEVKIQSSAKRFIRFNLYSCFHILMAHQRHHLLQAETALKNIEGLNESATHSH